MENCIPGGPPLTCCRGDSPEVSGAGEYAKAVWVFTAPATVSLDELHLTIQSGPIGFLIEAHKQPEWRFVVRKRIPVKYFYLPIHSRGESRHAYVHIVRAEQDGVLDSCCGQLHEVSDRCVRSMNPPWTLRVCKTCQRIDVSRCTAMTEPIGETNFVACRMG